MELTIAQALEQAITAHRARDLTEAERLYRAVLQTLPSHPDANHNLGVLAVETGQPQAALPFLKAALEAEPERGQFWLSYIETLIAAGQLDGARLVMERGRGLGLAGPPIDALVQRLASDSAGQDDPEGWLALATALSADRDQEALVLIEKALQLRPNYAEALGARGMIRGRRDDIIGALADLRAATEIEPRLARLWAVLSALHHRDGNLAEAIEALRRAHTLEPGNLGYMLNLGEFLRREKSNTEAIAVLEKAVSQAPDNASAWTNLGTALYQARQLEKAEAAFDRVIALDPDNADVHRRLGATLFVGAKMVRAGEAFQKSLDLDPDNADIIEVLSIHALYTDDISKMAVFCKKLMIIGSDEQFMSAAINLATILYIDGHWKECEKLIEKSRGRFFNAVDVPKRYEIYLNYISRLLSLKAADASEFMPKPDRPTLYVVGESHSLGTLRLTLPMGEDFAVCAPKWIPGCKQWHLGNGTMNMYKCRYERVTSKLPEGSNILLTFGEIDCRHDGGILRYSRNNPGVTIETVIESTAMDYLDYVSRIAEPLDHHLIIQGVPCPDVRSRGLSDADARDLVEVIRTLNDVLKRETEARRLGFLDVYALTDRGDGISNQIWHMDDHHLSPAGIKEAWRLHYHPPLTAHHREAADRRPSHS